MIRKDIRQIMKIEREEANDDNTSDEDDDYLEEGDRRIEDKIMYGSDSDKDIDEIVHQRPDYEYYVEDYGSEDEGQQDGPDDLEFDGQANDDDYITSGLDDEDGITPKASTDRSDINNSVDYLNQSADSSSVQDTDEEEKHGAAGTSIEMVDLSKKKEYVMKEFQVAGKVNQS